MHLFIKKQTYNTDEKNTIHITINPFYSRVFSKRHQLYSFTLIDYTYDKQSGLENATSIGGKSVLVLANM
jgi:hypothetical protein